jgi:hypothetical protein
MAQAEVDLAVYCEPLLLLSAGQCPAYHQHVARLSQDSCVLSITASEHDALELGGPHAHVTRQGWHWVDANLGASGSSCLHVEGMRLCPVVAQVVATPSVTRLQINKSPTGHDQIEIVTPANAGVVLELIKAVRAQRAAITRIFTTADHETASESPAHVEPAAPHEHRPRSSAAGSRFEGSLRCAWRTVYPEASQVLRRPRGIGLLLGQPLLAALYVLTQGHRNPNAAVQESLEFVATLLVPLGALYLSRFMFATGARDGSRGTLARYGANRRAVVAVYWLSLVLLGAVGGAGTAVTTLLAARGCHGLALAELGTAAWIVALGGSVYVGFLQCLSTAPRGWLLWAFLLFDYVLGAANLGVSAIFPHAHLMNLLGANSGPLMPQQASCIFLGALLALALGLTLWRTDP